MANGGWYETQAEWERLEAPLLRVDPLIADFAVERSVRLTKNNKDWPERSLKWGEQPSCLIQLYLAEQEALTWNLWLCCSEDREGERFWRKDFLVQERRMDEFAANLPALLAQGFARVNRWADAPEQLEFATKLTPLPKA